MDRNEPEIKRGQVYAKPQLIEFGSLEKLTKGGSGTSADGPHSTQTPHGTG